MWIEKASAQRPELVQMLLVAFSRRMCCSRVESVSTKPRLPSASTVSPQRRPGIWRMNSLLRRHQADIGAAEVERVADRLALADDDVGAERAGRLEEAERDDLGDDDDQQRAGVVGEVRELLDVAERAVEVGRLDDDGGGVVVDRHRHACRRGRAGTTTRSGPSPT